MSLPPSVLQQEWLLGDLLDLRAFADVCRSFAELYRVGVKVFDARGDKLVDVAVGNADFCGYLWQQPAGRAQCIATVGRVKNDALPEEPAPRRFDCFSGCRYSVLPVLYEGDVIGRIVFGPYVPDELVRLPASATAVSPDFDAALATGYQQQIRRVQDAVAARVVRHFGDLLEVLVFSGHKNLLTARLHIEAVQESFRELEDKGRALEESYEKLKELDRLKSNFLATVSHELRTPLTSVIGYSEMMLDGMGGALSKEQREFVSIIMDKGENLLHLITSILDITKIEAGRLRLLLTDADLGLVVRDAVDTVRPAAHKKGVALACDTPCDLPPVHCDADKVRQSLVNLAFNAVKFTPAGGKVTVGARPHGPSEVVLWVADDGIGIEPEHLKRIFDVFYQVDDSTTREHGGVGLGLAIVKSFMEAHGGKVTVASTRGRGSTFTLLLPLRARVASADRPAGPPAQLAG
ncbi:MAG TPA: ATP-binding protein [Anaeromyxobacteraceae bacterium]|nr:ATP-binding protein [Anaeromyxobacteraceae bacterium]